MATDISRAHPFRAGPSVNPWDHLERQSGGPRALEVERTAAPVTEGSALDQVLSWLQDHHATLMADPLKAEHSAVTAAIHEAIMHKNLRKNEADALNEQVIDRLLGAGALAPYFRDPGVTEIMVVGRNVFVERDGRIQPAVSLGTDAWAVRVAQLLCRHEGLEYQSSRPLMNFTWNQDGSRINIVHHSKSPTGVAISIRKRNQERTLDLPDLLNAQMLSDDAATLLVNGLAGRLNVIFSGPPGSGKTSVVRAVAVKAILPTERVITLEDTEELRLPLPHLVALIGQVERPTTEERERGIVSLQDLFRNTLRMRYDRLIMGELRGPEALDFIEAAMSSEGGMMSTMHLRTPELLADRLYQISHKYQMGFPYDLIQKMVFGTVDLLVQVERDGQGHRHLTRIVEVERDGTMTDLHRWNPTTHRVETVGDLSAARQLWIHEHTRVPGGLRKEV